MQNRDTQSIQLLPKVVGQSQFQFTSHNQVGWSYGTKVTKGFISVAFFMLMTVVDIEIFNSITELK